MNFQNIEYFLAVAEEKSITRAAEKNHLTQQALSGHIIRLEEELGCPLFKRKPSFALTYAGECFFEQAQQMLNLKHQSESMLRDIRASEKGRLRIGITYSRGQAILPMILPQYAQSHPKVELSIVEDTPQSLGNRITQGTLDVMIDVLPFESNILDSKVLFDDHLFFVINKKLLNARFGKEADIIRDTFAKTGDLSLLKDIPYVFLQKGEHIRTMIDDEFCRQRIDPVVCIETSNAQTALALAIEGMGITIVHEIFLKSNYTMGDLSNPDTREKVEILPFKKETVVNTVGIGYHRDRYMPKITRDFVELCQEKLCRV